MVNNGKRTYTIGRGSGASEEYVVQGRVPPHSIDAERSVLGSILLDKDVASEVFEMLSAEDFYIDAHVKIYSAMEALSLRNSSVDMLTVSEELSRMGELELVGGRGYIAMLTEAVPTTENAVQYAAIVEEKSILRKLISAATGIVASGYNEELPSDEVLDKAEKDILEVSRLSRGESYIPLNMVLKENIKAIKEAEANEGAVPGLATEFKDLDEKTAGFQKSDLIIIAARPSMGKTALALNIALNACMKSDARVAIFSLEMSQEQLGMRLLSMQSRIDSKKLRIGDLTGEDWENLNRAVAELANAKIIIDDTPGIGVMEIRRKCRRFRRDGPLDLIIVDYLQMMSADRFAENRQQEVSLMSRYLKQLAREMECPVVVLSQLSRATETRAGSKKPILSDLRESGAIEQDADVVMFLYREDYYKDSAAPHSDSCEIIIAKQRNGETGSVYLTWIPQCTKFVSRSFSPVPGE